MAFRWSLSPLSKMSSVNTMSRPFAARNTCKVWHSSMAIISALRTSHPHSSNGFSADLTLRRQRHDVVEDEGTRVVRTHDVAKLVDQVLSRATMHGLDPCRTPPTAGRDVRLVLRRAAGCRPTS